MKKTWKHRIKCGMVCLAWVLVPVCASGCGSLDLDFFGGNEKISDSKDVETTESQTKTVSSEEQETTTGATSSETLSEASSEEQDSSEEVSSEETTEAVIRQSSGGAEVATEEETEEDLADDDMDEYILPYSNSEYLTWSDLESLNKRECMLARNEIYARRGRLFKDAEIQAYFDSCSWYRGTIAPEDFTDDMLNAYERANKDLIVEYEQEMGYK